MIPGCTHGWGRSPLMLVGDQGFLQYAGSGWAYPFAAGILSFSAPVYALFGAALIGLLGIPPRDALRSGGTPVLDKIMLVLGGWLSIAAAARVSGFRLVSRDYHKDRNLAILVLILRGICNAIFSGIGGLSGLAVGSDGSRHAVAGRCRDRGAKPLAAEARGGFRRDDRLCCCFLVASSKQPDDHSTLANRASSLRTSILRADIPSIHRRCGVDFTLRSQTRRDWRCRSSSRLDPIWPLGDFALVGPHGQRSGKGCRCCDSQGRAPGNGRRCCY